MNKVKDKKIPDEWQPSKLGDVADISTGKKNANEKVEGGEYPFFTCAQEISRIDTYTFDTEAILVAGNGDFNVKYYDGKFDAYQRTYVVEPEKEKVYGKFLYLSIDDKLDELIRNNQGSTINYLRKGDFTNFDLELPPLKEQKKIAEILSEVEKVINKTDGVIEQTEQVKRGLVQELFGAHDGWKKPQLGDICNFERGVTYSKSDEVGGDGYKILRATNIDVDYNQIKLDEIKNISKSKEISQDKKLRKNDILMCTSSGSVEHLGKVALIRNDTDFYAGGFMGILRPKNNISSDLLYSILSSELFDDYIEEVTSGTNIQNLKLDTVSKFKFNLPPKKKKQEELAKILSSVNKKIQTERNYKQKLHRLKKGLMQDLLSGKVRAT